MSPVVQQLLTLAGVLLGASASFAATTLTERSRWRRTHSTRWDDKRLLAYTDYANAIKTAVHVCYRLAGTRGFPAGGVAVDLETGLKELSDAERDRTVKWELVLLLGSPTVTAAARRWHECLWRLEALARGEAATEEDFLTMHVDFNQARDVFYGCARADLGVTSGELPSPGLRDTFRWKPLEYETATGLTEATK